ncbi:SAF domain-containing protein [Lentzea sp. NPDC003310]|uniref:SAF domain-containing protein n=1 Tax=Lentzea sp. NPDC003310 TaxID=3154447 RepID=UPI0033BCF305
MTATTTKQPSQPSTWGTRDGNPPKRWIGRRRRIPHLVLGLALIPACGFGGAILATELGERENVLALARPVAAGQVLVAQDLRPIAIAVDVGTDVVVASAAPTTVGQPFAYSLPEGTLVTRSMLGEPQVPEQGKAIAAVGLKPGQFPPDLAAGTTVAVLLAPGQGTPDVTTKSWTAVVLGVSVRENEQTTVVSLRMSESDGRALLQAPAGQVSLLAIAGGNR